MFQLNIRNERIAIRDILPGQLPCILQWYNRVEDFKFATGIEAPITLNTLDGKFAESAASDRDFLTGIHVIGEDRLIGLIKGRIQGKTRDSVWINSIVIDPEFQKRGYGSSAIKLLMCYLKLYSHISRVFLAVALENRGGRIFWEKNGFREMRRMRSGMRLNGRRQEVIIMCREI